MKQCLIGNILLDKGLIDEEKLKLALDEQARTKDRLGETLVNLGCVSEADMLGALSVDLGIPALLPHNYPQSPPSLDRNPNIKFLRQYRVVPVERSNGTLTVVSADPQDPYPAEVLRMATGLKVEVLLGTGKRILEAIDSYYGNGTSTVNKIIEDIDDKEADEAAWDVDDVEHLKDMALEAPIINLVNLLITRAVEKRASDIHIEPFENVMHVRYRVDGILSVAESLPKRLHPAVSSRVKIMSKLNIAERRLPQDGRIRINAAGKDIDIRISTVPTHYGESIVMRLLDPAGLISLESIGFSDSNRAEFTRLVRQPHGMILVTGPTGSGKSTTLYSALSKIDTVEKKVITIEDPIEYNIKGINQIQVKPKISLTFANGLRSIVRQDPDVIMVGEIRDTETADIAIHSALTGHLILSTLHTNDAPGAVTRLIDMGVESYLISSSLLGVLAQRLVRVICPNCKVVYKPQSEELRVLNGESERVRALNGGSFEVYRGTGCDSCGGTGYRGRTGIFEMMSISDRLRQLIVEKKSSGTLRAQALEEGMVSLREDGWDKVKRGVTTIEEIARVTLE